MIQKILYLFTRTPLHVGSGASVGALDQPVQRERHTGFPIVPGSSIKGVLRDHFEKLNDKTVPKWFGRGVENDNKEYSAGKISFGEAKLLAFPVRSAKGAFALVTSSLALQRFARDAQLTMEVPAPPGDMTCLAGSKIIIERGKEKGVVLEEYRFSVAGVFPAAWEKNLSSLLRDAVLAGAGGRFVLLSDGDLSHFAVNACMVSQHVKINSRTGTADKESGGLFDEEAVPSETLFYSVLTVITPEETNNPVFEAFRNETLIQFGGSGTTGLGFCTIKVDATGDKP